MGRSIVAVGSYGTRNVIEVIGIIGYWERPTDCIVLIYVVSKFLFSGDPLFLGRSPSPVFTARNGPNFPATDLYPNQIRCLKSNSS
jgi:hypothetical protein